MSGRLGFQWESDLEKENENQNGGKKVSCLGVNILAAFARLSRVHLPVNHQFCVTPPNLQIMPSGIRKKSISPVDWLMHTMV